MNFAQNLTLVATQASATKVTTDPMAVGPDQNKLQMTVLTHNAFDLGGTPTHAIVVVVEGSNDGQTWFTAFTVPSVTGTENQEVGGDMLYAFCRITATNTITGVAGDWGMWVGDIHGDFKST